MSMKREDDGTDGPILIDTHAHLELEPLVKDPQGVVERARGAGVAAIITVGIDLSDAYAAMEIVDRFDNVYGCVGFHPHNAKLCDNVSLAEMEELAKYPKVVGYGEIGLDYFRNLSPQPIQRTVFVEQLYLAKALGKPIVIHLRSAYDEGLELLEKHAPYPAGGVIHCFSGEPQHAQRALDLGFHISIPGTITYKKNDKLRSMVKELPEDRILLETDCPFLSPEPKRGKDNEPANIVYTAQRVAEVRGTSLGEIARTTTHNAMKFFKFTIG